jgi:hypothetical protein
MAQVPGGNYKEVVMQGTKNNYTGTITGATATGNGTAVLCTEASGGAYTYLTIQITGINGDTITFEGTIDGTNWIALEFFSVLDSADDTTATANGIYRGNVRGLKQARARISTYGTGTIIAIGVATAGA